MTDQWGGVAQLGKVTEREVPKLHARLWSWGVCPDRTVDVGGHEAGVVEVSPVWTVAVDLPNGDGTSDDLTTVLLVMAFMFVGYLALFSNTIKTPEDHSKMGWYLGATLVVCVVLWLVA